MIAVIDFETYYSSDYSLSKKDVTIENYVRSEKFKVHGMGYVLFEGNEIVEKGWLTTHESILSFLKEHVHNKPVVGHHMQFDGFILSQIYNTYPSFIVCTMSMVRALIPLHIGGSLKKSTDYLGLGKKGGVELEDTKGKVVLSDTELANLGSYCVNDCVLTYELFKWIRTQGVPKSEYSIADMVIKMYTDPIFNVDVSVLDEAIKDLTISKEELLDKALACSGATREDLRSNPKFALVLKSLGVEPPKKISPATGKETLAFSKTDEDFLALLEHDDVRVQVVMAARFGAKSTLMETRMNKFKSIGERGTLPIYLNYGTTRTHRLSGGDKINPQNLTRGSVLRKALVAPDGYKLVVVDSSNIELRVNMQLSRQDDAVTLLREGTDLYCAFASKLFEREITKADKAERQLGKVALLGLGYGMGDAKFFHTAKLMGVPMTDEAEAKKVVDIYRATYPEVTNLWARANKSIDFIYKGVKANIDVDGICTTDKDRILLPTGLPLRFDNCRKEEHWVAGEGRKMTKLYGGKIVENLCQALARNIIMEQTLELSKKYRIIHSIHDEVVMCVPEEKAEQALQDAITVFSTSPTWWPSVPLGAEGDVAVSYGDAK